jgi:AbrB family looped-hinge helix DNA binding protein
MTIAILQSGKFPAMRTTIDPAGRLVIPKRIRDRLGLRGNEQVEITERDGRIEIEPAPTEVGLVREGSVLVARPDCALPPLTDEIVRETLDRVRR